MVNLMMESSNSLEVMVMVVTMDTKLEITWDTLEPLAGAAESYANMELLMDDVEVVHGP